MSINDTDYRTMMNVVIGPILNYVGFHVNNDGIIQKIGDTIGITLSGKHLYVPDSGKDYFDTKDSPILVPFNPFRNKEHLLILSKFLTSTLSDYFRDEDDENEYDSSGRLIDIVSLVKRGPTQEDLLPATFNGVIYEYWLRGDSECCRANGDLEVLGQGVDYDKNDIKAMLMAMLNTLSKVSLMVDKNLNFEKLYKYVEKCIKRIDIEVEEAMKNYSNSVSRLDLSGGVDDVEELETAHKTGIMKEYESVQHTNTVFDEMDFV